jgi:hypothetical protein
MSCPKSTNRRDVSTIVSCNALPVKLAISPTTRAGCTKDVSCNASTPKLVATCLSSTGSDVFVSRNAIVLFLAVRFQYPGVVARQRRTRRLFSDESRYSDPFSERSQRRWLDSLLACWQAAFAQYC